MLAGQQRQVFITFYYQIPSGNLEHFSNPRSKHKKQEIDSQHHLWSQGSTIIAVASRINGVLIKKTRIHQNIDPRNQQQNDIAHMIVNVNYN